MAMARVSAQQRLISTYYDTPGLALKQRGLTLRVRDQGGHFLQTVKEGDLASGDLLSRGEWEDAVAESRPDPEAAQSGPRLPEGAAADLRPFFVTEVTRTIFTIEPLPGTAIEAAVDEGEIRAADKDRAEPISEVELELKGGDVAALYDLAAQLLRNEPAVLSAQPEGVHQMRVAVRRLRSAISSLKKILPQEDVQWVTEELRWLGGSLGPARNLDVFAAELLPVARTGLPDEPGWDDLGAALDRLRAAAYDQIRQAVLSQRYIAGMLRLLRWFEASGWRRHSASDEPDPMTSRICALAPEVLDRRRRKVRQRGKGFGRLVPRERHKLRIAVKKLRYTIELFGSLFDMDGVERFVGRLKRLQSDLGYANDVRVAHEFVIELFAEIEPRSPAAHAWVAVLEAHDQMLAGREQKLRRHRRRLTDAAPFWRD